MRPIPIVHFRQFIGMFPHFDAKMARVLHRCGTYRVSEIKEHIPSRETDVRATEETLFNIPSPPTYANVMTLQITLVECSSIATEVEKTAARTYLLNPKEKPASMDQIAGELDIHDSMITSLAEVLEQKGVLTQAEWEKAIKKRANIE